jgi:RimJ/RimL family protein N-acetyltransferase
VLTDDYQGRGIGTRFSSATFEAVDDEVLLVFAEVYDWNHRVIGSIEKHAYMWVGTYRNEDGEVVRLYARGRGAGQTQSQAAAPSLESSADRDED